MEYETGLSFFLNSLTESEEYRRLCVSFGMRALAYRGLFNQPLAAYDTDAISAHLNKHRTWIQQVSGRDRDYGAPTRQDGSPGAAKETEGWRRKIASPFFAWPFFPDAPDQGLRTRIYQVSGGGQGDG